MFRDGNINSQEDQDEQDFEFTDNDDDDECTSDMGSLVEADLTSNSFN